MGEISPRLRTPALDTPLQHYHFKVSLGKMSDVLYIRGIFLSKGYNVYTNTQGIVDIGILELIECSLCYKMDEA